MNIVSHSAWGKCRPTTFGASSKFNKHEFKKKKIEYNRIQVTRFKQPGSPVSKPGTRFLNQVINQLTTVCMMVWMFLENLNAKKEAMITQSGARPVPYKVPHGIFPVFATPSGDYTHGYGTRFTVLPPLTKLSTISRRWPDSVVATDTFFKAKLIICCWEKIFKGNTRKLSTKLGL